MRSGNPKHIYLVGYMHEKGQGRAVLHRNHPIQTLPDLLAAEDSLSADTGCVCSIFTYQLIEVTR
ncbi:hypothetical protein EVB78_084 [Rhizobium phage RHph_N1_15]|nr:hypothetical protein EVB77_083 [Rhizobium phage RHph_N1_10]QIG69286.1 hypothetical protein EVB78_084 [Rhizobium phage RHph_N1_15]QIG75146.1 hypothetical protein EVC15_084 [Rhizobium phage RHph_N2_6]